MARLARIAVPEIPYHITQRGNRRRPVFSGNLGAADDFDFLLEWQPSYMTYRQRTCTE